MDELETLDEKGNPPKSRLSDARKAYEIWNNLKIADKKSSFERARIDAAYDNEKPFSDTLFANNGQDYRVNVCWGWAKQVLDTAMAGYVDILNAVQKLFKCPTTYGHNAERMELESVVEDEVSDCIRSWRDFFPTYLRLCLNFIKHGVAMAMPNDEFDWRFSATDLSDFKIPRNTKLGQENIEVAACLRYYTPTQLYRMIRDPMWPKSLASTSSRCARRSPTRSTRASMTARPKSGKRSSAACGQRSLLFLRRSHPQLIKVVHLW